jgi:hypothetical protein
MSQKRAIRNPTSFIETANLRLNPLSANGADLGGVPLLAGLNSPNPGAGIAMDRDA